MEDMLSKTVCLGLICGVLLIFSLQYYSIVPFYISLDSVYVASDSNLRQISDQSQRVAATNAMMNNNIVFKDLGVRPADTAVRLRTFQYTDLFDQRDDNGKCEWWRQHLDTWTVSENSALKAIQEHSGVGDRLSGLIAAVQHSIIQKKSLDASWENIDTVFKVNPQLQRHMTLSGQKRPISLTHQCLQRSFFLCSQKAHTADHCPVYNRACIKTDSCNEMKKFKFNNHQQESDSWENTTLEISEVVGCAMRNIVHPTEEFLMATKVDYIFEGKQKSGTIAEIVQRLQTYDIISVHIRSGDEALRDGIEDFSHLELLMSDFKFCANHVETELVMDSLMKTARKKGVKWFIASDDIVVREYFVKTFPKETVMILTQPQHMQHMTKDEAKRRRDTTVMMAEWYLLGYLGEKLIVNEAHTFGTSSFPRSAWLFNLKQEYYLLRKEFNEDGHQIGIFTGRCLKKDFEYEGNLRVISKVCQNKPLDTLLGASNQDEAED